MRASDGKVHVPVGRELSALFDIHGHLAVASKNGKAKSSSVLFFILITMKHLLFKTILLVLFPLCWTSASASVEINGICYNLNTGEKTAEVASSSNKYTGDINIPASVNYEGVPYSVTSIGEDAFYGCSGLTSVTIPNSVTTIGYSAFSGCSGLTSVTIPSGVTSIGSDAFSNCSGLTSVTIPASVTSIGSSAFGGCVNVSSIKVESGNTVYDSRNNCNAIIKTATNTLIQGCNNSTIPSNVTGIEMYAFRGCSGLTSIVISAGVTSIGVGAFSRCSGLTSIRVANGNTVYDSRNDCNAIIKKQGNILIAGCQNTIIPSNVTQIGGNAFDGCSGLTSITLPASITYIDNGAFLNCPNLMKIFCYAEIVPQAEFYSFDNVLSFFITLYVPSSSIGDYRKKMPWRQFGTILPIPEPVSTDIDSVEGEWDGKAVKVYGIDGRRVTDGYRGLRIVTDGRGNARKVLSGSRR